MSHAALDLCPSDCSHQGTCVFFRGLYSCVCNAGFGGSSCSDPLSTSVVPSAEAVGSSSIVPWFLSAILAVGLVGAGGWIYNARRSPAAVPMVSVGVSTDLDVEPTAPPEP